MVPDTATKGQPRPGAPGRFFQEADPPDLDGAGHWYEKAAEASMRLGNLNTS